MTDSDELNDLATMLEKKSKLAVAKAALHLHHGRTADHDKEVQNADYCRRKAEVCRRAAGPKPPKNKALACAPTQPEWIAYSAEIGWPEKDAMACFDHFQSNGWKIGGKTQVRDWKAAARNGMRRWIEKNPKSAIKSNGDPEGWADYLNTIGRKYVEYRYESEWLKAQFRKQRK